MPNYPKSLTSAHKRFLKGLFPDEDCLLSPEQMAPFSADASLERAMPWGVVRPQSREQIEELLKWAQTERMPIYGRARGTGRVGNAVPSLGGLVVSMLKMNRVLEVDEYDAIAVTQPGVITSDLQNICAEKKMFYPPDPASVRISTIGGNVSTCAGGLKAVKYGVTRDWVLGLEAVLPGGKVMRSGGRSHKDVVGLDLTRLFVGANGKLGLITEITVKLIPLPEASASVLVGFSDLQSSLEGAKAVFQSGVLPAACEFMDRITLEAVRQGEEEIPLADSAEAALLFKLDGTEEGVNAEVRQLVKALEPQKPVSIETGRGVEEERIWTVRRGISPAAFRIKPTKLAEDISVPRSRVAEAVERAHKIGESHDLTVLCFGHLGDGNIHVNIMHDGENSDEVKRAHIAKNEVFRLAVELGGTISGEHGTGLTKAYFVPEQLPALNVQIMNSIKSIFDPQNIMNPGKGW
ncbi:FAD-linked oxidase C-terminal domain-containing protein [Pseudodesulfovibrio sp. zrk46]|uniref:FAD-binding oxidoreductase n=1 Tax=Pseudodesulfovibrio sp. zrk46 TaxID=2725288 RepID=UPI0014491205|nr:FAD-linked oxidase C-terminal domain-containing protein [Pseudodesulfovibrio sp. zrk46]QJB58413.1 FAD-binding protein [Pseudodesulfovibrio sp. zrk46]